MTALKTVVLPLLCATCAALCVTQAEAQLVPEIGYVFPPGGRPGTTVDVVLGGYDWSPDMQLFPHDAGFKLELTGPCSPVLVPDPPYWFGAKGRGPAWPLPREFPTRLTIPADAKPGLVRWQAANANGASPVGLLHVSSWPEVVEPAYRSSALELPALPVTVSGQIRRIEEVDRYRFKAEQSGLVTIELVARQLNSPLHGILRVHELDATGRSAGQPVLDVADTEGRDLVTALRVEAGRTYELSLHDVDFAGDRSYVYRLLLTRGPLVLATCPAAGRRGETRPVEFTGIGLLSGGSQLESVTKDVAFPAGPEPTFLYTLETPHGASRPVPLRLSEHVEHCEPATAVAGSGTASPTPREGLFDALPAAVTGRFEERFSTEAFALNLVKGGVWRVSAASCESGSPRDLELQVLSPDGKPLMTSDDAGGSTDSELLLTVPADGRYQLIVLDRSGRSGHRAATYRLAVEPVREDFIVTIPVQLPVPIGTVVKLPVKVARAGGFKEPVTLKLTGLPEGVTAPAELVIPGDKNELQIDLTSAANAPAAAVLCGVKGAAKLGEAAVERDGGAVLVASTLKPRIKITPEGLDDVRKINRGSTFLAPLLIERLEGFAGDITLEMTSKQQRHRQGLRSDELRVTPDMKRVEYPIFVPEWMETTKTSRMIMNGTVQVADPRGTVRTLVQKMELRVGVLPEGALLKLSHTAGEPIVAPGATVPIALSLSAATDLKEPLKIELLPDAPAPDGTPGVPIGAAFASAEPLIVPPGQTSAMLSLKLTDDPQLSGERTMQIRVSTTRHGWPVRAETTLIVTVGPKP